MFTFNKAGKQSQRLQSPTLQQKPNRMLSDNRPEAVTQRKMSQLISASTVNVAQRQKIESLTGNTVQREAMPDDELQMKADNTYQREALDEEMV